MDLQRSYQESVVVLDVNNSRQSVLQATVGTNSSCMVFDFIVVDTCPLFWPLFYVSSASCSPFVPTKTRPLPTRPSI